MHHEISLGTAVIPRRYGVDGGELLAFSLLFLRKNVKSDFSLFQR